MPYERRQGNVIAIIALVVTLVTNVIALTWGASKLSSAVISLEKTTESLGRAVSEIQRFNNSMEIRMTRAETLLDGIRK